MAINIMSDDFQAELRFLGITSSPAFVPAPEGNRVAKRFICTLKEQLLWVRTFQMVEELRQALLDWLPLDDEERLVERHGFHSPRQVHRDLLVTRGGRMTRSLVERWKAPCEVALQNAAPVGRGATIVEPCDPQGGANTASTVSKKS